MRSLDEIVKDLRKAYEKLVIVMKELADYLEVDSSVPWPEFVVEDDEQEERVEEFLEKHNLPFTIVNLGKSGSTGDDYLDEYKEPLEDEWFIDYDEDEEEIL